VGSLTGTVSIALSPAFQNAANSFAFEIAGPISLTALLNEWGSRNAPKLLAKLFDPETGFVADSILIVLNGRSVKSDDPETTIVSPGDSLYISPIVLGG